MKLIAKTLTKNKRKDCEVELITRDGWVVTKDGAFGDLGDDCELYVDLDLKKIRNEAGLTQQEMAWVMGISRPTYSNYELHNGELSLKDYLCLKKTKELFNLL